MKKIVLVGGGGHARACIDVIRADGRFQVVGILDRPDRVGTVVLGIPVIGTDEDMPKLVAKGMCFTIALGQIKTAEPRKSLYLRLRGLGAQLPVIVAPTAYVSDSSKIMEGSIVMHMAVVGPAANIGANCIVNTRALLEHDVEVGDHCHLATGVLVNGNCRIGSEVFIGSGAILHQSVQIADRSVIGMGTIVRRNLIPTIGSRLE